MAFLYKEGLKAGTIKSYLAATQYTNFVRSGESPHRRHEQTGIRDMGAEKAYQGPDSHQASDHPPTACAAARCMAHEPVSEGCLDVVGSSYDVLFWFPEGRRGCWAVRLAIQSQCTSVSRGYQCGQLLISYICCGQYQGFQDRLIQARGDDLPGSDTWYNMSGGHHAQIYGREGPIEGSTVPVQG